MLNIEGAFGQLKTHYNLNEVKWLVPGGETLQIGLGLGTGGMAAAIVVAPQVAKFIEKLFRQLSKQT